MAAHEDPAFAAAIGAGVTDIAVLHENVETSDLSAALEKTILESRTGKCSKTDKQEFTISPNVCNFIF